MSPLGTGLHRARPKGVLSARFGASKSILHSGQSLLKESARPLETPPPLAYLGTVRFIETSLFTDDVEHEMSLDEYRQLQLALLFRPAQGALIHGSGGLRKMRWRRPGMGKRGGLRVIYYWEAGSETFYMLTIYRKTDQDDLTHRQTTILRRLVEEEFK